MYKQFKKHEGLKAKSVYIYGMPFLRSVFFSSISFKVGVHHEDRKQV